MHLLEVLKIEFLSLVWPFTMGGYSQRFLEEAEPRGNLVPLCLMYYTHRSYMRGKRAFKVALRTL